MKLVLAGSIVCVAATLPSTAQTLVRTIIGPVANEQFGKACIVVPDQNGDGFKDLLVGAPGFNSQRGVIFCLSGAFLALGTGQLTLWSLAPTANQGDLFGSAMANVGDATGDGVDDFLVGQPGYDITGSNDVGAVRLINGASHAVVSLCTGNVAGGALGTAIARRGATEVVVSAPGPLSTSSHVYVCTNSQFATSGTATSAFSFQSSSTDELGASLAVGDVDGDGYEEIFAGAPGWTASSGANAGAVTCLYVRPSSTGGLEWGSLGDYLSTVAGERLGTSVDCADDYDGDGVFDIVVGAPNSPHGTNWAVGRAAVVSGARLVAHTPPYEIHQFFAGSFGSSFLSTQHFGAAVRACDDLNNDGVGDILVGAPDYGSNNLAQPSTGSVSVYSGASGEQLCSSITGAVKDKLGGSLTGAFKDFDGDGFKEFVVAGPLSDAGGTDSGVVKIYRLFPIQPAIYCTGKVNSLGCTPAIAFSGTPSASSSAPFLITASNFINQKNGLLFYSHAPVSVGFQGGFKCAANPTVRTPPQNSGGSTSGSSCTGAYSFDFNNWVQVGWDSSIAAGSEVYAQYWSRDPQSASHTSLSDAIRFVINP